LSDDRLPAKPPGRIARALRGHAGASDVMVIGLGHFGTSLALTLEQGSRSVFGIDAVPERVAELSSLLTQAAVADTTEVETLRQLGAADFDTAVVAIGNSIEASVLTTAALADLEVPTIWARADSDAHARILERVGAHRVVQPMRDMGRRVARLLTGKLLEFVELDDGFALGEVVLPVSLAGQSVGDLALRERHGVTVVCAKSPGRSFSFALPSTVLGPQDILVVAGSAKAIEAFAALD
jgi:trk system potassium uptake protein